VLHPLLLEYIVNTKQDVELNVRKYVLVSVDRADPLPTWLPDGDWFRYIIWQGNSKLEGYKIGSIEEVTEYAETVTEDLNERMRTGKYTYTATKKQ